MVAQLTLPPEPQDSCQQNLASNFGPVFVLTFTYLIFRNVKPMQHVIYVSGFLLV